MQMTVRAALAISMLLSAGRALCQSPAIVLPSGTPLVASTPKTLSMRVGTPVDAQLLYPVYAGNTPVLAKDSHLLGSVIALEPDHDRRVQARLRGDFTPFRKPVVRFDHVVLPDGTKLPITTGAASDGAPVFRLVPPPPRKGGFFRQQFDVGVQMAKDRVAVVTGPDKRDRLVQLLYSQLPVHPQRIEKLTAWTVQTAGPVNMAALPRTPTSSLVSCSTNAEPAPDAPHTWIVQAFLNEELNSENAKSGQAIHATVAEPICNADQTIAVPQGATLDGAVTQARAARSFGRAGVLRFDFNQITFPSGESQKVQASLTGIDAANGASLAMDSEGKVKPKPQDKVLVPLILFALASRPLDRDGGDNQFGKSAVASNSLGLVGFIVGTTSRAPNFAAGLGYYGTAVAVYNRWIKRGAEISFARDTRIVVQTTARRTPQLTPTVPRPHGN